MKYALYGPHGDLIDLRTFVQRQSPDPKKWTVTPFCDGCGEPVHDVGIHNLLGFKEASRELLFRARQYDRAIQQPHFAHYKGAGQGCPYSRADDPLFAPFKNNPLDSRDKEKIREILFAAKDMNSKIINRLYLDLTGMKEIPISEKREMWALTEKKMCRMSVLADNPWIFPYAQILFAGARERTFGQKTKSHTLIFRGIGEQKLVLSDFRGRDVEASIPREIGLYFVNTRYNRVSYAPFRRDGKHLSYALSKSCAEQLAR